jgi:hypothetical protein
MPPAPLEIARRENGRLIVRPDAVRVRFDLTGLTSSDGHAISAVFSAAIRAIADGPDRRLFEEAFLTRLPAANTTDVLAYFAGPLQSAAKQQVTQTDVQSLWSDAGRAALLSRLTDAARSVAFACGLDLLPPFELELDSPSLRQQQEEQRRAAAQTQRLSRASAWFKDFKELRAEAPELPAEKILQRIASADPAEQAELLRSLLMSAAKEGERQVLWAVAGPHLIKIESDDADSIASPRSQLFSPPEALGPFRSVQGDRLDGKQYLLIGARSGVLLIDPQSPTDATLYTDSGTASSLGFNAAKIAGGKIWATHGEAGLVAWDIAQPDKPALTIRPAAGMSPRNLTTLDDARLLFTSDTRVFECSADGAIRPLDGGGGSTILAVLPDQTSLLIVCEDGQLHRRDRATLTIQSRARRSSRITAAGSLPWLGGTRLLLATETSSVLCVGMDDELVTQYASPHTGLRQTAAALDRVAAVSADRQRIILWPSWDGRQPAAEIHVTALARHRVADVEFV